MGVSDAGWVSFLFITSTIFCLTTATAGVISNLPVYLISQFNVKSIEAAQITNITFGCVFFFPVVAAAVADSLLGCFKVVLTSLILFSMALVLFIMTSMVDALRHPRCEAPSCESPTMLQLGVLYSSIALVCAGVGGSRLTIFTFGAQQFTEEEDESSFFNKATLVLYVASVVGATVFVYVQDDVSWALGFALCAVVNLIGVLVFSLGRRFYRHIPPQGSSFVGICRVIVVAVRKVKMTMKDEFYHGKERNIDDTDRSLTRSLRFLNRAAMIAEGDLNADGTTANPWKLCTVREVEDAKKIFRLTPLWSSGILLSVAIGVQSNLTTLQALATDRRLWKTDVKIPAGSLSVQALLSGAVTVALLDCFLHRVLVKLCSFHSTKLQLIGVGHLLTILSMAAAAMIESKRLKMYKANHNGGRSSPMSVFWLFPQLTFAGMAESILYANQVGLFYRDFPASLRNMGTGIYSLLIGVGFYSATAVIVFTKRMTSWLPDDLNDGRLDNLYWAMVVTCVVNFVYYLICAKLYKIDDDADV